MRERRFLEQLWFRVIVAICLGIVSGPAAPRSRVVGIDRIMSEGRALTNAVGTTVARLFIANWRCDRGSL